MIPQDIVLHKQGVPDLHNYYEMDPNFTPSYQIGDLNVDKSKFTSKKLRIMLNEFGQFPDKYRKMIYRIALKLPMK